MGLENLKSIFNNNINERIDNYKKNNPQGVGESRIAQNVSTPILDTFSIGQIYTTGSPPILSSVNSFVNNVNDANGKHPFQLKNFLDKVIDAKPPQPAKIPTDYSSAGIEGAVFSPLSKVQQNIYTGEIGLKDLSWENLYQPNHTPKNDPSFQNITPISYPNVDRDKLNIRNSSTKTNLFNFSRNHFLGIGANEPYIVSDIPQSSSSFTGGRITNTGSQEIPIIRALVDGLRLTSYLSSPAGFAFIAKQNLLGLFSTRIGPDLVSDDGTNYGIKKTPQKYNTFYNPLSSIVAAGARLLGTQSNVSVRRDFLLPQSEYPKDILLNPGNNDINISFMNNGSGALGGLMLANPIAVGTRFRQGFPKSGDKQTNLDLVKLEDSDAKLEAVFDENTDIVEGRKNGMPFYFKDMRDNTYIVFRAYLEGLSENVAPTWAETNYMGRSEPVYSYERASREINFSLKLVAQTPDELQMIYKKMNRLTSLCYPEYVGPSYGTNRMKPPLTKFRLGDMFGTSNDEMLGFIKSLSYSVEQTSTWETLKNRRVPKHITATINYQIIHGKTPSLKDGDNDTKFYGYVGNHDG